MWFDVYGINADGDRFTMPKISIEDVGAFVKAILVSGGEITGVIDINK